MLLSQILQAEPEAPPKHRYLQVFDFFFVVVVFYSSLSVLDCLRGHEG